MKTITLQPIDIAAVKAHGPALCLLETGQIVVAHKPKRSPWQTMHRREHCRELVWPVAAWAMPLTADALLALAKRLKAKRLLAEADAMEADA